MAELRTRSHKRSSLVTFDTTPESPPPPPVGVRQAIFRVDVLSSPGPKGEKESIKYVVRGPKRKLGKLTLKIVPPQDPFLPAYWLIPLLPPWGVGWPVYVSLPGGT